MNILILGDCIATGQNCLTHTILSDDVVLSDFNRFDERYEGELLKWFLRDRKHNSENHSVSMSNLMHEAYKYKSAAERRVSWPTMLGHNVTNLAVVGETYLGMYVKLQKYMAENKKPDLILLTDFTPSHIGIYINSNGTKTLVRRDLHFINKQQHTYHDDVYEKFVSRANIEVSKGADYIKRKNQRSYRMLSRSLLRQKLNFKFCAFYKDSLSFIDGIDCTHLPSLYNVKDGVSPKLKLLTQSKIADFILKEIGREN